MKTTLMLLVTSTLALAPIAVQTQPPKDIRISLVSEKSSFMLGEPIFLAFNVHNDSAEDRYIMVSDRQSFKKVTAVRGDGLAARDLEKPEFVSPDVGGSAKYGPHKIPSRGSYTFSLFLPNHLKFDETGDYTVTAVRSIKVLTKISEAFGNNTPSADVQASTKVSVVPFDRVTLGEVIRARGAVMLGPNLYPAQDAARALRAIDDDRTIEYFIRAITESGPTKGNAVDVLGRVNSDPALAALKRAAQDADHNVRNSAASALSESPHPGARAAFLELRTDPEASVRLRVLQGLIRMPFSEALEWIRPMTNDADGDVRGMALAVLLRTPSDESLKLALQMASDPESRVRGIALTALATKPTPESVDAIRRMTKDPDKSVRGQAKDYLKVASKQTIGIAGNWFTDCDGNIRKGPGKYTDQELWRRLPESWSSPGFVDYSFCSVTLVLKLKTDAKTDKLTGSIRVAAGQSSTKRNVADGRVSGSQFSFHTTVKIGEEISEFAWTGALTDQHTLGVTAVSPTGTTFMRTLHRAK